MSSGHSYSGFVAQPADAPHAAGLAAGTGDLHQSAVPVTPQMDADALLAAHAAGLHGLYSHPVATSSSDLPAMDSMLLGFRPPYGGLPVAPPCGGGQPFGAAASAELLYPQGYAKLGDCLQGALSMAPHASTPPLSVHSPEFMSIGLDYSQTLQMHAPLPQVTQAAAAVPMPTAEAIAAAVTFTYPAQIMGPTHLPAEPFFGNISHADAATALMPSMAAPVGQAMQMYAHPQQPFGRSDIPSLSQTPQPEAAAAAPAAFAIGTPVLAPAMLLTSCAPGASDPALQPAALPFSVAGCPAHLLHLRPQRPLGICEPVRARSSSPCLTRLTTMPFPATGSSLQRRNTGPRASVRGAGAQQRQIRSHTRAGSEITAGCSPALSAQHDTCAPGTWRMLKRRLSGASAVGHSRTHSAAAMSCDSSAAGLIVPSALVAAAGDNDGSSLSDDACSVASRDGTAFPGPTRTPSGRIALSVEQREVFFRWLYENVHDPKPKGIDRDRLRRVGNMSRERFKTWFANARRRYFKITFDGDVQRYTVNARFRDACQRANITLDE
ncbi:hypothetical protein LPJ61_000686 [Coemansia biformis]|uniref:Homeobox domain-containing protein n=1 Tax=Coemansia biformis TaxID=1286918 RepID=A0A9W7YIC7_9FUNG|nr:hypothetical protein LPJ61_000686 [Coemansia biformis]